MAKIDSRFLFITTSPRSPEKMLPEIDLLNKHFAGRRWNEESQRAFMELLREEECFKGEGAKYPAFSARDRINRAPKSLGLVELEPAIRLTDAGRKLLLSKRKSDVFLRQLLKFQLPSPYHIPSEKAAKFWVKPYLEIIRLIRVLGTLRFDELQIFGMQITDYRTFDSVVEKIELFRRKKAQYVGNYKVFKREYLEAELSDIYVDRIVRGDVKTRETDDVSLKNFLRTQSNNLRDYADACFRYLSFTGLVRVSQIGKSLSIVEERIDEVDYILNEIDRNPVYVDEMSAYTAYLGNADVPLLLTDDRKLLEEKVTKEFPSLGEEVNALSLDELKEIYANQMDLFRQQNIEKQVADIKEYRHYDDIQNTYDQIIRSEFQDIPLMMEWNTWRAMTMLDGGDVRTNLSFDDYGRPLATAAGNMSDIVCDYGSFMLCVEVTVASGQKQYEREGEPVTRHLGQLNKTSDRPCYCLFIAPNINEACVSYFYSLHHVNLSLYGGRLVIVPLPLQIFRKMIEDTYRADYKPDASKVQRLFELSKQYALQSSDETEWYDRMKETANRWLEE